MPTNARSAGIVAFGDALLRTGDLDPVYTAIHKANLDARTRMRLVLAYWCFYHLGAAARMAEAKTEAAYWGLFREAVENKTKPDGTKPWPRGAERRHFRGDNALAAYQDLVVTKGYRRPEDAVSGLLGLRGPRNGNVRGAGDLTFRSVSDAVQTHVGFGPWIAFKIADMAERVLGLPVDFSGCELGIYKDPRQGAALAFMEGPLAMKHLDSQPTLNPQKLWEYPITDEQLKLTVEHYTKVFGKHKAPPTGDRPVNVQEVETIFCKYKSHLKGHYPVGKDTEEVGHGLLGWGDLAEHLNQQLHETRDAVWAWRKKHGT